MELLDSPEDLGLEETATFVVDGYLKAISPKKIPPPPHVGMAFVSPLDSVPHFIAWENETHYWVVNEKTHYGMWAKKDSDLWKYIEEKPDGRRTSKKVKTYEMNPETGEMDLEVITEVQIKLGPRPGLPGNNPDWQVGDRVSLGQGISKYDIVATGDLCVLMMDIRTGEVQADSNTNLSRYYRREESKNDMDF